MFFFKKFIFKATMALLVFNCRYGSSHYEHLSNAVSLCKKRAKVTFFRVLRYYIILEFVIMRWSRNLKGVTLLYFLHSMGPLYDNMSCWTITYKHSNNYVWKVFQPFVRKYIVLAEMRLWKIRMRSFHREKRGFFFSMVPLFYFLENRECPSLEKLFC